MLTPLDELLMHQVPLPMSGAASPDVRFYDRHWFEGVSPDGTTMAIAGIGVYKNTGMCDGFLSVQRDGAQHNVRLAAPLDQQRPASVGPLAVHVDVPFQVLRIELEAGEHPLAAQLTWTASGPARLEQPTVRRLDDRLVQDSQRYGQLGRLAGVLRVDDVELPVADWWAVRDHSWGIRPGVGGDAAAVGATSSPPESQLHLWVFASAGDTWAHVQQIEDGNGNVSFTDGVVARRGIGEAHVIEVSHDITFVPGTREWSRVLLRLALDDGSEVALEATPLGRPWAYRGTGYGRGYDDGRGLGAPRPVTVEWDELDLARPGTVTRDGSPYRPGHREQPGHILIDGCPGTGHLAVISTGVVARYGLRPRGSR